MGNVDKVTAVIGILREKLDDMPLSDSVSDAFLRQHAESLLQTAGQPQVREDGVVQRVAAVQTALGLAVNGARCTEIARAVLSVARRQPDEISAR